MSHGPGRKKDTRSEVDKKAASRAVETATDSAKDAAKDAVKDVAKAAPSRETDEERWKRTKSNVRTIAGALLLAFLIRKMVFEPFAIEGPSMEPTLLNGDRVIVANFPFGVFLPLTTEALVTWGMPEPGDVVIVSSPADNVDIIKRVIGLPGDRIEVRDDEVFRNGESIRRRTMGPCREDQASAAIECEWVEEGIGDVVWRTSYSEGLIGTDSMPPMIVPDGHIFVLGDHRDRSNDSRNPRVGMIPISRVRGRALAIYWSNDQRIRWDRIFSGIH